MPPRVSLREVVDEDLPVFFAHQADPEACRVASLPPRPPEAFLAHWDTLRRDPTVLLRTVLADGEVAGNLVCYGPPIARLVGYWLGRAHWGRGIATMALHAFLPLAGAPLFARVAHDHWSSMRVLEKCGFVLHGEADGELVYRYGAAPVPR